MPRLLAVLLFLVSFTLVSVLVHYYLWTRLVRNPALPSNWRRMATWLIVGLGLSIPAYMLGVRTLSVDLRFVLAFPVFIWMGLAFLLFTSLLGIDLFRLFVWFGGRMIRSKETDTPDPGRRAFLARLTAGAVTGVGTTGASVGTHRSLTVIEVKRVQITLSRLPEQMDGFSIVQLTDLHLGDTLRRPWLEQVVRRVNSLTPDLIAITGDLVDGSVSRLGPMVAPLTELRAPSGVFFVPGNHEYYSGIDEWLAYLARLGLRVLRNERASIGDKRASFDLAGVDDHHASRMKPGHGPDLARALAGRDPRRELVLLAHQPRAIFEASRRGVGLQLSGHTHGGQIWPWGYLVRLQQPYVSGLARHGGTQIYVSEGTGFWGPPLRLGTTNEITQLILRSGS